MLNLIDEHTRESLLVRPERRWSSAKVIESLADVMVIKGVPEHIRSDNGPEFVARDLRKWLADTGAKTLYIEPGSSVGERLLRELQLKAAGRVHEWRDLLLVEGGTGAGRTLAGSLQHHPSTLFARLQIAGTGNVATRNENRVWRSGKQSTLSTSPHPRRRPDTYKNQCATLTIQPVQKIGHPMMQTARRGRACFPVGAARYCWHPTNCSS